MEEREREASKENWMEWEAGKENGRERRKEKEIQEEEGRKTEYNFFKVYLLAFS